MDFRHNSFLDIVARLIVVAIWITVIGWYALKCAEAFHLT